MEDVVNKIVWRIGGGITRSGNAIIKEGELRGWLCGSE